jgi:hypothetical protein
LQGALLPFDLATPETHGKPCLLRRFISVVSLLPEDSIVASAVESKKTEDVKLLPPEHQPWQPIGRNSPRFIG